VPADLKCDGSPGRFSWAYDLAMAVDEDLERTIAAHLAAGDLAAAATLALTRHGPQILGYLGATLRDDDAAYDVFGQFSEELWKSIGSFRGESSFKTWAYKLVMHAIGRHRRDPYRRRGQAIASEQLSALVLDLRSRTPHFKSTEVKDRITRLRESLEPEEQTLLFLRIDQELSGEEVAAVVSAEGEAVDAATLRKRFERAKVRLRKLATAEGLLDEPDR
jgi:RNA polymerase sigma-70 factor (ECF subfamily)